MDGDDEIEIEILHATEANDAFRVLGLSKLESHSILKAIWRSHQIPTKDELFRVSRSAIINSIFFVLSLLLCFLVALLCVVEIRINGGLRFD